MGIEDQVRSLDQAVAFLVIMTIAYGVVFLIMIVSLHVLFNVHWARIKALDTESTVLHRFMYATIKEKEICRKMFGRVFGQIRRWKISAREDVELADKHRSKIYDYIDGFIRKDAAIEIEVNRLDVKVDELFKHSNRETEREFQLRDEQIQTIGRHFAEERENFQAKIKTLTSSLNQVIEGANADNQHINELLESQDKVKKLVQERLDEFVDKTEKTVRAQMEMVIACLLCFQKIHVCETVLGRTQNMNFDEFEMKKMQEANRGRKEAVTKLTNLLEQLKLDDISSPISEPTGKTPIDPNTFKHTRSSPLEHRSPYTGD